MTSNKKAAPERTAQSHTVDKASAEDSITVLESFGPRLTKKYLADGGTEPYEKAQSFKVKSVEVTGLESVAALLGRLHKNPKRCIIRGKLSETPEPGDVKGSFRRCNASFDDQPLHTLMLDIDGFEPFAADPVKEPADAVRELFLDHLPACFMAASFYWHLSSSAGMPGKERLLKCHVWMWSKMAYTSAQMKAWADSIGGKIDRAVYSRVQVNYTADPIFEEGRVDPIEVRAGWYQGTSDEVDLQITEDILAAAHSAGSGSGGEDMKLKDPSEKPGIIGLFHRTFSAEDVLLTLLDEFEQGSQRRYTWLNSGGGAPEGVWAHDDQMHIASSHNTWPLPGIANLWDVVRVFKFGHLDEVEGDAFETLVAESRSVGQRASDKATLAWAEELPEIKEALIAEADARHTEEEAAVASLVTQIASASSAEVNGAILTQIRHLKAAGLPPGSVATLDKAIQQRMKALSPNQAAPSIADVRKLTRPDTSKQKGTKGGGLILTQGAPYDNAVALTRAEFTDDDKQRIAARANGSWFVFNGRCYEERTDEEIKSRAWPFLAKAVSVDPESGSLAAFKPGEADVNGLVSALKSILLIRLKTSPGWLHDSSGPEPLNQLVMQNGILDIGSQSLSDHTPLFFSVNELPFAFHAGAQCPAWVAFLDQVFPGDRESQDLLQDWFGYCLTADTSQQKMLNIVGQKRSGKGTIARILGALIGSANVIGPTLTSLVKDFGLEHWLGKLVAIFGDARGAGRDHQIAVERILSITGEDMLSVDRKNKSAVSAMMTARITLISNELLQLGDASGALVGRMLALKTTQSFYGREDTGLTERVMDELPGILNWALAGKMRLAERGRFLQPSSAEEMLRETQEANDPVGTFFDTCFEIGPGYSVTKADAFDAYCRWCAKENMKAWTHPVFSKAFRASKPEIATSRPHGADGKQHHTYVGIRLSAEWAAPLKSSDEGRAPLKSFND